MSPKTFTFFIYSKSKISGTAADYYVQMPQGLECLTGGQGRPDFYELYLDQIAGTLIAGNVDESVTVSYTSFVQLALDFPAPLTITNGNNNVKFIIPITGSGLEYKMETVNTINPVMITSTGLSSMIHVQLFTDTGVLINPGAHEHVIVLTIKG